MMTALTMKTSFHLMFLIGLVASVLIEKEERLLEAGARQALASDSLVLASLPIPRIGGIVQKGIKAAKDLVDGHSAATSLKTTMNRVMEADGLSKEAATEMPSDPKSVKETKVQSPGESGMTSQSEVGAKGKNGPTQRAESQSHHNKPKASSRRKAAPDEIEPYYKRIADIVRRQDPERYRPTRKLAWDLKELKDKHIHRMTQISINLRNERWKFHLEKVKLINQDGEKTSDAARRIKNSGDELVKLAHQTSEMTEQLKRDLVYDIKRLLIERIYGKGAVNEDTMTLPPGIEHLKSIQ